jgi:hypothetical protein
MLATGCFDDPPPAGDGSTGAPTTEPGTTSAPTTSPSTTTDPTTGDTTGETTASATGTDTSSSSGPAGTTTGDVLCDSIPDIDTMPPMCPSDQALADPPITCLVGSTLAPGGDTSSCAAVAIPGSAYGFTAPEAGVWVFTVLATGLEPDPLIVVFDDQNAELGCSTDLGSGATPPHQAAAVAVDLAADQAVRIVVQPEAAAAMRAPVVLRVATQLNCGGDCCEADRGRTSCEFDHYAECTCTADDTCCSDAWTDDCAALATGLCLAGCGEYP